MPWKTTSIFNGKRPFLKKKTDSAANRAMRPSVRWTGLKNKASRKFLNQAAGRDTLYFAENGLEVYVLDYSENGIHTIQAKAAEKGLSDSIHARQHDLRTPLPFADGFFEGSYSHMLYCMAFTGQALQSLGREVRRVLKPGGIHLYTARNTADPHYGTGIHRGENRYEVNGFIVHFFDREMIDRLAEGYELLEVSEFEEGSLPRRLYFVAEKKKAD